MRWYNSRNGGRKSRMNGSGVRASQTGTDYFDVDIAQVEWLGGDQVRVSLFFSTPTTESMDYDVLISESEGGGSITASGELVGSTGSFPGDSDSQDFTFNVPEDANSGAISAEVEEPFQATPQTIAETWERPAEDEPPEPEPEPDPGEPPEPPDPGEPDIPTPGFDPSLVTAACETRGTNPAPGEETRVDVTYRNDNAVSGVATVEVVVNGEVIDTRETTLSPGTYQKSIPLTFEQSGEYTIDIRVVDVTR